MEDTYQGRTSPNIIESPEKGEFAASQMPIKNKIKAIEVTH